MSGLHRRLICLYNVIQVSLSEGDLGKKLHLWLSLSKTDQENSHKTLSS